MKFTTVFLHVASVASSVKCLQVQRGLLTLGGCLLASCSVLAQESIAPSAPILTSERIIENSVAHTIVDVHSTPASNLPAGEVIVPPVIQSNLSQVNALAQPRNCYTGDVWEVSTRHLPCCKNLAIFANPNLRVYRVEQGRWASKTIQDLFDATGTIEYSQVPSALQQPPLTIFYVHGNWMTEENTRERILIINRSLSRYALRPYRLVVLSWPSQRERGFVSDIRENAECADIQSHYLNYLIQHVSPASEVSLMGFSFGARTVTGALHLLSGGSLFGIPSQCTTCQFERKYRVTLIAPAVDRDWIAPNGRYSQATRSIEWMVNLYNSKDPVLRRFRFINRVNDPVAAGFIGFGAISDPRSTSPLNPGELIEQFDCGSVVGNSHDEKTYYAECPYFVKGIKNLLGQYP